MQWRQWMARCCTKVMLRMHQRMVLWPSGPTCLDWQTLITSQSLHPDVSLLSKEFLIAFSSHLIHIMSRCMTRILIYKIPIHNDFLEFSNC